MYVCVLECAIKGRRILNMEIYKVSDKENFTISYYLQNEFELWFTNLNSLF